MEIKGKATAESRRLDSLARLFEASMTCAAVCIIDKTVYITTNDIYAVSTKTKRQMDNKGLRYLEKTTKHLLSKAFRNDEAYTDQDIDILLTNYKGKLATQYKGQPGSPKLSDGEIKRVITHLLNQKSSAEFMNEPTPLSFFTQFHDQSSQFIKQSDTFRKNIDVQKTFSGLWRDVRDYKKFKKMVISGEFDIEKYCILAIGQQDEHAEMRMLGFLLNQEKILLPSETQSKLIMKDPIYFGISKLCCPYCNITLNVFNKLLLSTNETETTESQNVNAIVPQVGDEDQNDDEVISSEHLSERAVSALIQMGRENSQGTTLEVRGGHELKFKWMFPAFARHIDTTHDWICKKVEKVKDLTPNKKNVKKNLVYHEKTNNPLRCVLVQNASILKKGKKNVFKISPCVVEFALDKSSMGNNKVIAGHISTACTAYYCPGFRSQVQVIALSDDGEKTVEEWSDLLPASCEKTNLICLQNSGFHAKLVTAFKAVSSKVIETTSQVRMVASTSSSSVEDQKLVNAGDDLALASLLPEEPDSSYESQHAEDSSGDLNEHDPDPALTSPKGK